MLESLDGTYEVEPSVLERQVVRGARGEGEIGCASGLPFRLQPRLVRVDSQHCGRCEPFCQSLGHDSLAAADVENRGALEACRCLIHSDEEAAKQVAHDPIRG